MRTASVRANTAEAAGPKAASSRRLPVTRSSSVCATARGCRELALADRTLHRAAVCIDEPHALPADLPDVAFLEEHEAAGDRQQRRDVGSDVVLAVADADHDRTALACNHDPVGIVVRDDRERVGALELGDGGAHGLQQVAGQAQVVVNTVRDHLGIRLGGELVAEPLELGPQLLVVLDDPVVHDRDPFARDVRMRVALARHAMRGPAGVRDADFPVHRVRIQRVLKRADFAYRPATLETAVAVADDDARRVIAPVLEPAQPLDQVRHDVATGDGSNDSTHGVFLVWGAARLTEISKGSETWPR
jgi:hypothetical protein